MSGTDAAPIAKGGPVPGFLALRDVRKTFSQGAGLETIAFDSSSLDVAQGEFVSLIGRSGCGKSSLLKILAGLLAPTAGDVLFEGARVDGPPDEVVYVFQQYSKSLFPWRTVLDNVAFPLEGDRQKSKVARREAAHTYLERVGLAEFAQHYPWQLSGGMQQRVAIARALAAEPRVLLMDEPFSAVDALTRMELQTLVLDIWSERSLTILFVTHDVEEAIFLSDRVAVFSGSPSRIGLVVETELPRPRDPIATKEDPRFLSLRHSLLETLLAEGE